MRNLQAQNHTEMNCEGAEKYINGEEVGDNGQLGNDGDNENDATDRNRRAPEQNNDEFEEENVEYYDASDLDMNDGDGDGDGDGEFLALNSALDELQGALDNLESRNAGIHNELLQLLQSNREMRTNIFEDIDDSDDSTGNIADGEINAEKEGAASFSGNADTSEISSLSKLELNCSTSSSGRGGDDISQNVLPGASTEDNNPMKQ